MSQWWVQERGAQASGPLTTEALVQSIQGGRVSAQAMVCATGATPAWVPVVSVPGFAQAFQVAAPGQGPNPYAPPVPGMAPSPMAPTQAQRGNLAWMAIIFTAAMALLRTVQVVLFLFFAPAAAFISIVSVGFYLWAARGLYRGSQSAYRWVLWVNILSGRPGLARHRARPGSPSSLRSLASLPLRCTPAPLPR